MKPRLHTPFDYPNCEQMGNSHHLLKSLYSDRFLGFAEVESRSNLILTGPRGCGKTTVFKALSLDYRLSSNDDDEDSINYIGVYYRCDDLYFSFPRYKLPKREEALNIPVHYVAVTLIAQLLSSIKAWGEKRFEKEFHSLEANVSDELWTVLGWNKPHEPGANSFARLIIKLRKERGRAANKNRVAHDPKQKFDTLYFGPEIIVRVAKALREHFSFLINRPVYFFVDDYSEPKITAELQANLNRLFMIRTADRFFKISTESPVSYVTNDIDGKSYVEAREFNLINLGMRYIIDGGHDTLPFIEDLFQRRFNDVEGYPVTSLDELIGSEHRVENKIAKSIIVSSPPISYYGKETLAALCSGDIHYMIRLVERMVEENGGREALTEITEGPKISFKKQHSVIRAAAGDFIESIRMLPKHGPALAEIVSSFGNVARSYLKYRTSSNEGVPTPWQASRIEPYETLKLSDESLEVYKELLRYSIFLHDPRGKSRRGDVVPRLYLRRYLIPHFNLTFSQRDSIGLDSRDIELLLLTPKVFEKNKRYKSVKDMQRKTKDDKTDNLFGRDEV